MLTRLFLLICLFLPYALASQVDQGTNLNKNKEETGQSLFETAVDYGFNKYEFEKAIINFEKAIKILEINEDDEMLVHCYIKLANIYNWQWNFEKSTPLSHKAYDFSLEKFGKEHENTGQALLQLGMAYNGLNEFDESINYYLASLDILHKIYDEHDPSIGALYQLISNTHLNKKSYKKAITFSEKYIDFLLKNENLNRNTLGRAYVTFSMMLHKNHNYVSALHYIQKGITIYEKQLDTVSTYDMGFAYMNRSTLYLSLDSLSLAEESAEKSLNYLEDDPQLINVKIRNNRNLAEINRIWKNFEISAAYYEKIFERFEYKKDGDFLGIINKGLLFQVLSLNAKLYSDWGKHENNIAYLNSAVELFSQSLKLYDLIRNNQTKAASKSILSKDGIKTYEAYLEVLNELYRQTKDPQFQNQIFDLCEKSKASLLHESIQKSNALNFTGIPDSLITIEHELKAQINTFEKERENLLKNKVSETSSDFLAISTKLFELDQQYQLLEKHFEKNYPDYYLLKYNLETISINKIQEQLITSNETVIEYFVGEQNIFISVINDDEAKVIEIEKDFPLDKWVKDFRKANEKNYFHSEIGSYCEVAHELYNKLIAPVAKDLKDHVIIIPDGILGYIPFEALLVQPARKAQRFKNHHYLIKDKIISYSYSATLLKQMKEREHKTKPSSNFLGLAPFFDGDTLTWDSIRLVNEIDTIGLKPLPGTGAEIYGIHKKMGGKVFYHRDASEHRFINDAKNYRILHLATHGKANDKAGDFSYLAFAPHQDNIGYEILYMRDLYSLELNADMVVLSACETGIGELQKGEGIISLARGFTFAGAKSIITSLWSVEDECTKDIMISFYQYLDEGFTKDTALRQAKLDFINNKENAHVDVHPYYWSPFIGIGDMGSLFSK